jgi:perosamine synthetase
LRNVRNSLGLAESRPAPIPVAAPDLSGKEETYAREALQSSWISSTGPFVERFEREFAERCGTRTAISVCNGTAALHLAMLALGVGPGDEVLVPSLTYVATANAVRYVGAEPVFVDVDPATWCISPAGLEGAVTERTKGIVAVHLYGHPADMDAIAEVANARGIWVLEDAAEAHLSQYKGRPAGSLGIMGVFSFYGNKILTSGEGGAITVNSSNLERRIRILRGQGMDPERRYWFPVTGYNYRLTNVACALLCAQLERAEEIVNARRRIFRSYRSLLSDTPGIGFQPVETWARPAPWLFSITVDSVIFGRSRDELMTVLDEHGIETRPFFIPLHHQPPFAVASRRRGDRLPVAEWLGASGISLPTFPGLAEVDVERIAETIRQARR